MRTADHRRFSSSCYGYSCEANENNDCDDRIVTASGCPPEMPSIVRVQLVALNPAVSSKNSSPNFPVFSGSSLREKTDCYNIGASDSGCPDE
eukprot:IDg19416t1